MTYDFAAIVGKEFDELQISEWVKAHNGNWDNSLFFIEKINAYVESICPPFPGLSARLVSHGRSGCH